MNGVTEIYKEMLGVWGEFVRGVKYECKNVRQTCEVTGANIRRGLPKIFLSSSIPPRAEGCSSSLSIHPPRTAGLSSRFSCIAEERAWLPQPILLFPPTTRGQRCSSQLIFSRKSPHPSSSTNSS
ncbi:unnamed protein product [Pleuronectes platessa]|uniref:Uncharacterized protein n=1 Tax=Pleuronectes platessa TaxID=8262 RepID=A0A9N7V090_PLEPL|nr:unnamed protein product [Pleuronectes platessa]